MSYKSFYVYLITNLISGKQYIGSKVCYKKDPENDEYMGSSKSLNEDYKIYGIENFTKEILEYYDDDKDLLDNETRYILKYNTLAPSGYNKFLPNQRNGFHMRGLSHSEETKQKMRGSSIGKNKGRVLSEEHKRKIAEGLKGKNIGKVRSRETRQKISDYFSGRSLSDETKEKISHIKKGKKNSSNHNKKIKESWTDERKALQSQKIKDAWKKKDIKSNI